MEKILGIFIIMAFIIMAIMMRAEEKTKQECFRVMKKMECFSYGRDIKK